MRPTVAVTTNYDQGYEMALAPLIGNTKPAVMPWKRPSGPAAPGSQNPHGPERRQLAGMPVPGHRPGG